MACFQTIVDFLSLVVIVQCVLNKFKGNKLLSDALNFVITMNYKVKEVGIVMDGWWSNVVIELSLLANIKKEVCDVLDFVLSFLKSYEKKKTHNMLSLMLDPQFKTFHLVFSFCSPWIRHINCGRIWYVFEILSSFTSYGKLWNWIYKPKNLWRLVWIFCNEYKCKQTSQRISWYRVIDF